MAKNYKTFLQESQELNYFNGIIDNFVMDKTRYNLWDSEETHGSGVLYAAPRYKRPFYPTNGKTVSFFGNGYLQHALGQFNGSLGFTAVELDFRTLHQNGIIMAISGDQGRYHFVIYIQNGQVNFYFEPDQDDGIILKSTGYSMLIFCTMIVQHRIQLMKLQSSPLQSNAFS